jgi:hypothetical protein
MIWEVFFAENMAKNVAKNVAKTWRKIAILTQSVAIATENTYI